MVMLHIKIKRVNMVANILPIAPLNHGLWDQKVKTSTFSVHGHVTYQIKGNEKCSNIQANSLSLHKPSTPWLESKVKTFFSSESSYMYVAYQINGNGA